MAFFHWAAEYGSMGLDIETMLVPVDASEQAERTLAHAVALAERYGAGVHALHVVEEPVARGLQTGDIDPESVARDQQSVIDVAAQQAEGVPIDHSTAAGFSPTRLMQHPGSVILDVAESLPADFIVVPRESVATDPDATIGKSAQYVIQYASQPVLSV